MRTSGFGVYVEEGSYKVEKMSSSKIIRVPATVQPG